MFAASDYVHSASFAQAVYLLHYPWSSCLWSWLDFSRETFDFLLPLASNDVARVENIDHIDFSGGQSRTWNSFMQPSCAQNSFACLEASSCTAH